MFKIVPRIGTCDAGFSSSKLRSSCLPFVVKQTTLPVSSQLLLSRTTVDSNFFHGPIEFEITRVNCTVLHHKVNWMQSCVSCFINFVSTFSIAPVCLSEVYQQNMTMLFCQSFALVLRRIPRTSNQMYPGYISCINNGRNVHVKSSMTCE